MRKLMALGLGSALAVTTIFGSPATASADHYRCPGKFKVAERGESSFYSAAADRNNNKYVCYNPDNGQVRDDNQNKQPGEESPPDGGPAQKPEFD